MADSSFGLRDITLDLNGVITARVIRDALKGEYAKVTGLTINGVTGAGDGTIVLRGESASGPIFYKLQTVNSTAYNVDKTFGEDKGGRIYKGLYVDALNTAWVAGATLIIHTA